MTETDLDNHQRLAQVMASFAKTAESYVAKAKTDPQFSGKSSDFWDGYSTAALELTQNIAVMALRGVISVPRKP
jgi:hypothetical protein